MEKLFVSKNAFTLSEVLITLGIIGVVAAMTMPSIIANHKRKEMESSFKKSYSALQQAMVSVDPDILSTMTGDDLHGGESNTEFYTALWSKFKIVETNRNGGGFYESKEDRTKHVIKTYNNKATDLPGCPQLPTRILSNGSGIGGMYNCFSNWLVIDTNSPKKGPNAFGQDLFYFGFTNKGKLIPLGDGAYSFWNYGNKAVYCSTTSTDKMNGIGCTKYAIANECPHDKTKTYWECLP